MAFCSYRPERNQHSYNSSPILKVNLPHCFLIAEGPRLLSNLILNDSAKEFEVTKNNVRSLI